MANGCGFGEHAGELDGGALLQSKTRRMDILRLLEISGYYTAMDFDNLTIAGFQKHISERYEKVDRQRGTAKTFLWLIEEIGELATALNGDDRANLEEEFADVIAWLCTLANINEVDLAGAIARKYLGENKPEGHK